MTAAFMPSSEMTGVISRLADLLAASDETWWSAKLRRIAREGWRSETAARNEIDSFWGGMGSLNDYILERSGSILIAENVEFDYLRKRLADLSREI